MTKLITDPLFGQNIQKIRHSCGLTQKETIAQLRALGSPLSRGTYSQIEMGIRSVYVSDLVALQKIFGVDFSAFFENIPTSR